MSVEWQRASMDGNCGSGRDLHATTLRCKASLAALSLPSLALSLVLSSALQRH